MINANETVGAAGRAVAKISSGFLEVIRPKTEPDDPTAPVILEYQWPSTAVANAPIPRVARNIAWIITSMVFVLIVAMAIIPVDQVISSRGIVVSKTPTILAQALDTSIVRSIDVHEGQFVHKGDLLARFDPTIAASDQGALQAQVVSLTAEVNRLQAEAQGKPYTAVPGDLASAMQASIYAHDESEYQLKLEDYKQKINELRADIARAEGDIAAYQGRLSGAQDIENMRKNLESQGFGSHLNTIVAMDSRLELGRALSDAEQSAQAARRDLAAMQAESDAFVQGAAADTGRALADSTSKLSDATQELNKAKLHRSMVELRASRDAIVQSVAKVSVGSVLQTGEAFVTLVPTDAPLEIEANISGKDNGFVQVGEPVAIKFDTFSFSQFGTAEGTVRIVSPDSFTEQEEERNPTGAVPVSDQAAAEPYFRARISVDRSKLHDLPPGFRITPGMPVTADIKVGRRTVLGYLLGRIIPVTQEGMREP